LCQSFLVGTQWNALHDSQIPPDAKTQVQRNVSDALFVKSVLVAHEHEK
jgi:metallophosphoesterase superfamily enzyme